MTVTRLGKGGFKMYYYDQVRGDAKDFISDYLDDFKEDDADWGGKSDEPSFWQWLNYDGKLHDYTDTIFYGYNEENICDDSNNLETDSGLWEGVTDWRRMREIQAYYTLKGDLWFTIRDILSDEELIPDEQID